MGCSFLFFEVIFQPLNLIYEHRKMEKLMEIISLKINFQFCLEKSKFLKMILL